MKRRARSNMAIRHLPSGSWEFDTPEDIKAWMEAAQAGTIRGPKPPKGAPRERKPYAGEGPKDPNATLSPNQAKVIGLSVGPETKKLAGGGLEMTHHEALKQMGVTMGIAHAVIDEMQQAGVARFFRGDTYQKDGSNFRTALAILQKHLPAKSNPKYYSYVGWGPHRFDDTYPPLGYVDPSGWR